jgi:hypothetical protein
MPTREDMAVAAAVLRRKLVSQVEMHAAMRKVEGSEQQGTPRVISEIMLASGALRAADTEAILNELGLRVFICPSCHSQQYVPSAQFVGKAVCRCCLGKVGSGTRATDSRDVVPMQGPREPGRADLDEGNEGGVAQAGLGQPAGMPAGADPLVGREIGPFRIAGVIHPGRRLYRAEKTAEKRMVALQLLPCPEAVPNGQAVRRLLDVIESVSKLTHRNILKTCGAGRLEDFFFLEMEYVEGVAVDSLIDVLGRIAPNEASVIAAGVLEALGAAHAENLLHLDVKPGNIIATASSRVKLGGFVDLDAVRARARQVSAVWYASPEQCLAVGRAAWDTAAMDGRADIYSLGVALYHMLTGQRPFEADTPEAVITMQESVPLPDPRRLNRSIPEAMVAVMEKMCAKKPEHRHATAALALKDIRELWRKRVVYPVPLGDLLARYHSLRV